MIHKTFLQKGEVTVCRVTFFLPDSIWADAIYLVGDFNAWSRIAHPMRQEASGRWTTTIDLAIDQVYQFRYLCDGQWMNDNQADAYWENPHGTHNSVLYTTQPQAIPA